ncbi:MAG TPA: hypothetical protein VN961_17605 [Streptosporangiaceae bacterium]|nr:hypothetical protein [Streptosporangiaceae bacterium]
MTQRRVGGEPGRDVAAQDGIDDAIGRGQDEQGAAIGSPHGG